MLAETAEKIALRERNRQHVQIYFQKTRDEEILCMIPSGAKSLEDALALYEASLQKGANSYGRTIYCNDEYIGDIWCYCLDVKANPNAMLSFCIFEKAYWHKGIATIAISLFIEEISEKFHVTSLGAFLYTDNAGSIRVLEKNGFTVKEKWIEDGRESCYCEANIRRIEHE